MKVLCASGIILNNDIVSRTTLPCYSIIKGHFDLTAPCKCLYSFTDNGDDSCKFLLGPYIEREDLAGKATSFFLTHDLSLQTFETLNMLSMIL